MYTRIVHPDIDHHSYSVVDIDSVRRLVSNRGDSNECSLNPKKVMTNSHVLLGLILLRKFQIQNNTMLCLYLIWLQNISREIIVPQKIDEEGGLHEAFYKSFWRKSIFNLKSASIFLFKTNNGNAKALCEISSKLAIRTTGQKMKFLLLRISLANVTKCFRWIWSHLLKNF